MSANKLKQTKRRSDGTDPNGRVQKIFHEDKLLSGQVKLKGDEYISANRMFYHKA